MNELTRAMVEHAAGVCRETGAKYLVLDADVLKSADDLPALIDGLDQSVVLVSRNKELPLGDPPDGAPRSLMSLPRVPLTRLGKIKIAVLIGVAEKRFSRNDLVVCLSGVQRSDRMDMLVSVQVGNEPEFFMTDEANPLPPDVDPAVFEHVLNLASELAVEGREHRSVGTTFVIGDDEKVLEHSRQLVFNPFRGYPEEERNLLTGDLDETVKEFAAIDGAWVIRGDGVVLAAGRFLNTQGQATESLRSGLGARHQSAAGITAVTDAVAIALSESTSTITVFNSGRVMTEIEKLRTGTDGEV